ncbi:MAG: lycopene beta-cyclase CrtY, partial [Janthinobacterium lividum]
IVEASAGIGGNHTWSSFGGDLSPHQRTWAEPLQAHRWDRYSVRFPAHRRTIEAGYGSATSDRLDAAVRAAVPPERLLLGTAVAALTPTSVMLADGRTLTAGAVIDGRGQGPTTALDLRWQKFIGLEVELAADHGLDGPVIMDATVPQHDGYRFVYTLPFAPRRLLVEDTYYSDGAELAPATLRARIGDYAAAQGWTIAAVVREEAGVLPIAIGGDFAAFWAEGAPGVPRVGLRAALFHPTTGYSFPDAVRTAELVAALPAHDAASLHAALRQHAEARWNERGFYRLLNKMLFDAAEPHERYRILERFYRLDAALVGRFYAGRSTLLDKARTLMGKPPVPLGRAVAAILR